MQVLNAILTTLANRIPPFDQRAVLAAYIAGLIAGWLWYAFVGQMWKQSVLATGGDRLNSPRRHIFSSIAQIVMTIALAVAMQRLNDVSLLGGVHTAFMLWFGFIMTTMLVNYSNLGQRLTLTFVDGLHWLLVLVVMGAIIGSFSQPQVPAVTPAVAPAAAAPATGG